MAEPLKTKGRLGGSMLFLLALENCNTGARVAGIIVQGPTIGREELMRSV